MTAAPGSVAAAVIVVAALVGIAVFGGLWELLVRLFDVEPFILLPPSEIVAELAERPALLRSRPPLVTGRHAASGWLIALAVALVVGVAARRVAVPRAGRPARAGAHPRRPVGRLLRLDRRLARPRRPAGDLPRRVRVVPGFVFATVAGLRSADPAARELLASVDASRLEVLWRLRLPSALPVAARHGALRRRRSRSPRPTTARAATSPNEGLGADRAPRRRTARTARCSGRRCSAPCSSASPGSRRSRCSSGSCCDGTCHSAGGRRPTRPGARTRRLRCDRAHGRHGPRRSALAAARSPCAGNHNRSDRHSESDRCASAPSPSTRSLRPLALAACGDDDDPPTDADHRAAVDVRDRRPRPGRPPPPRPRPTAPADRRRRRRRRSPSPTTAARPTAPPARSRYLSGFDFAATASIVDVVVAEQARLLRRAVPRRRAAAELLHRQLPARRQRRGPVRLRRLVQRGASTSPRANDADLVAVAGRGTQRRSTG